ncbi:MAG TPA: hypothetical protein VGD08_04930 [Stellaceae bacterium]|jgi:hypothetical protein
MPKIRWQRSDDSWIGRVKGERIRYDVGRDAGGWWVRQGQAWVLGPFGDPADAMQLAEVREEGTDLATAGGKPGLSHAMPAALWHVEAVDAAGRTARAIVRGASPDEAADRFREAHAAQGPFAALRVEPMTRAPGDS